MFADAAPMDGALAGRMRMQRCVALAALQITALCLGQSGYELQLKVPNPGR